MRKLLLALTIGLASVLPAAAQEFSVDELAPVKTTSGCYYMAHRGFSEADGYRHEWSGTCSPGAMISGSGSMTRSWSDGQGGRMGVRQTGQLVNGYWEGMVSDVIMQAQGSGPLVAQGSPFEEYYEGGCIDWKIEEGACTVYSTQIGSASSLNAGSTAPQPASQAGTGDNRLVKTINLNDLRTILTEEGHTINSTQDEGDVSIRATDTNGTGLIFNLIGTACDLEGYDPGCLGINMQVRYDADGRETLERINDANLMWAATSTWYSAGGVDGETPTVGITRYVILDGGMTVRNIKDNLNNLLAIAPQVADYVWQTGDYAPQ